MKRMRRFLAFVAALVMMLSCCTTAFAADSEVTVATKEYYQSLLGENPADSATITISKYVQEESTANTNKPIKGVKFAVEKVGHLAQIKDGANTYMAYGIQSDLADIFKDKSGIALTENGYSYFKDYTVINRELAKLTTDEVMEALELTSDSGTATDENGQVTFSEKEFGLYLVVETDATGATVDNDPITITKKQHPYVVSAPIYDETANSWSATINATAKNSTGEAGLEKEIVRSYEQGNLGYYEREELYDTDVTHVGDTVEFKLTSTVPDLQESNETVKSYKLQDNLSAGLTLPAFSESTIEITDSFRQTYKYGEDYTVTTQNGVQTGGTITEGSSFTVTFTESGLTKLTALAKSDVADKEVYTYYLATVNSNAVVGTDGNPNEARLQFQVSGSSEITTEWDRVTEFIFTMTGNKTFDGITAADKAGNVTFKLYLDENCTRGVGLTGTNGQYVYAGEGNATEIKLNGSTFSIKGVPVGTELWLKETTTASGFNVLEKPVKVVLTAAKGTDDEYTGYLENGTTTVNGTPVYTEGNHTDVAFTIDNTSGFQLPTTGGIGATIFAAFGVLIIAAGVVFYFMTSKRKRQ